MPVDTVTVDVPPFSATVAGSTDSASSGAASLSASVIDTVPATPTSAAVVAPDTTSVSAGSSTRSSSGVSVNVRRGAGLPVRDAQREVHNFRKVLPGDRARGPGPGLDRQLDRDGAGGRVAAQRAGHGDLRCVLTLAHLGIVHRQRHRGGRGVVVGDRQRQRRRCEDARQRIGLHPVGINLVEPGRPRPLSQGDRRAAVGDGVVVSKDGCTRARDHA